MTDSDIIASVRNWVELFVIGEDLCPFARRTLDADRVRFTLSRSRSEAALLGDLTAECERLTVDPGVETSLLVHPWVLTDFQAYNQFLDSAEALLREHGLEGELQIASFHPHYQFAGTRPDDAENYTNRSPYPMLHLLRESSIESAIANYDDITGVPARNIARLNEIGAEELRRRWRTFSVAGSRE